MKIASLTLLTISLVGNLMLFILMAHQSEAMSLIPRMKNELKIISNLISEASSKIEIKKQLISKGYDVKEGGEYYYAEKSNNTLSVGSTYLVFSSSGKLINIFSLSDSLVPIYERP